MEIATPVARNDGVRFLGFARNDGGGENEEPSAEQTMKKVDASQTSNNHDLKSRLRYWIATPATRNDGVRFLGCARNDGSGENEEPSAEQTMKKVNAWVTSGFNHFKITVALLDCHACGSQ